jgi:hypothetical protein
MTTTRTITAFAFAAMLLSVAACSFDIPSGSSGASGSGAGGAACTSNGECQSGVCRQATSSGEQGAESTTAGTCTAPSSSSTSATTSACEGYKVKEGDYRCADGKIGAHTIEVCKGGEWVSADTCSCSVSVGDPRKPPYSTSCSLGSAKGGTVCSYAGSVCKYCRAGESCVSL